jgi:hypothetical protein
MTHQTATIAADNALTEGTPVVIVRGTLTNVIGRISGPSHSKKTYAVFVPHLPGHGPYMAWNIPAEHVRSLDATDL